MGIDPGLNKTGFGIIKKVDSGLSFIASGLVKTAADEELAVRLRKIYNGLLEVISKYNPAEYVVEETFVNKNPLSSMKLGYARAACILAGANSGLAVAEYATKYIKKAIVGAGAADKNQINFMVKRILPQTPDLSEDEADALAAAICHAHFNGRC